MNSDIQDSTCDCCRTGLRVVTGAGRTLRHCYYLHTTIVETVEECSAAESAAQPLHGAGTCPCDTCRNLVRLRVSGKDSVACRTWPFRESFLVLKDGITGCTAYGQDWSGR